MAEDMELEPESNNIFKTIGMIGAGIVFIVGTAFGAMAYLDTQHVPAMEFVSFKVVNEQRLEIIKSDISQEVTTLAFNANQAFIDTQYMVNQRELRWMDEMPVEKMSQGTKRHYKYLQESQSDLEKRKAQLREEELKLKKVEN